MLKLDFSRYTTSAGTSTLAVSFSRILTYQNSQQSSPNLEFDMVKFKILDRSLKSQNKRIEIEHH